MRAPRKDRDARAMGEPAAPAPEGGRPGVPPQAPPAAAPLVLPCPLVVLGTTQERETGRPLSDLLRRIGYL